MSSEHRHHLLVPLPLEARHLFGFLADRAIPGVELCDEAGYRRAVRLAHGPAVVSIDHPVPNGTAVGRDVPTGMAMGVTVRVADRRDRADAIGRVGRLVDAAADPVAVDEVLGADPVLAPLVRRRPGLRVVGTADPHELVVQAIVGQQVSVTGARTIVGRIAAAYGTPLDVPPRAAPGAAAGAPTMLFPSAARLAALDPEALPMPRARGRALIGACRAIDEGRLVFAAGPDAGPDADVDPEELRRSLLALPGIGPWTADYVLLRASGQRDIFLAGDLALRRAAGRLGLPEDPKALTARAERWRPYRSYATLHLWCSLADPAPSLTAPGR